MSANVSSYGVEDAYCYGEGFTTKAEGIRLAEIRAQALRCHAFTYKGKSQAPGIRPGFRLSMERRKVSGMINAFTASNSDSPIPEIDEHGRYKVVFPLDVAGRGRGNSSCWIRRLREHVGLHHGTTMPLSPGIEVLVTFLDGAPDRPVIAGSLFNPQTGSVESATNAQIMGMSTAGGGGLTFNSTAGKQSLNLSTGGRSRIFMGSGSLDGAAIVTDSCVNAFTAASSTFAGLSSAISSTFSASLAAGEFVLDAPEILDMVIGGLNTVAGGLSASADSNAGVQVAETVVSGLKSVCSIAQALVNYKQNEALITDAWPYSATMHGSESRPVVNLQGKMTPKALKQYLGYSITHLVLFAAQEAMPACMSARTEELKKQGEIVEEWATSDACTQYITQQHEAEQREEWEKEHGSEDPDQDAEGFAT